MWPEDDHQVIAGRAPSALQSLTTAAEVAPPSHFSLLTSHCLLHDLPLVELDLLSANDLIGLMALAGQKDRIACPSLVQRRVDGGQPVADPQVVHGSHSLLDIIDNRVRILGA